MTVDTCFSEDSGKETQSQNNLEAYLTVPVMKLYLGVSTVRMILKTEEEQGKRTPRGVKTLEAVA